MRFETHLHTAIGSYDGAIQIEELVAWVLASGIGGVCITDHDCVLSNRDIRALRESTGAIVVRGVEVTTNMGHVLTYGLDEYVPGIHDIRVLRREVDKVGGAMVLAHPFRSDVSPYYTYGDAPRGLPPWEEVLARPVFQYVDALEACNGSGVLEEETLVRRAANDLGLAVTGGSDAHKANKLGLCITQFTDYLSSERDFIEAIRSGVCNGIDLRTHGKAGEEKRAD
ncbi:PHP-associated domain-containing protein [Alicyclobacillus dauci]|uniref:PHP domain-containing protein n=1 Tax=Alicyclobacillus dauci TaxID=1475485 RepID=A0ABY6Z3M7_9BACL|nr:PHP-associated domain-containing protein [Alicyclobacillus dauci]WAH37482.1 PHP domain-containing protein [Alicyclobacillus dauci]